LRASMRSSGVLLPFVDSGQAAAKSRAMITRVCNPGNSEGLGINQVHGWVTV